MRIIGNGISIHYYLIYKSISQEYLEIDFYFLEELFVRYGNTLNIILFNYYIKMKDLEFHRLFSSASIYLSLRIHSNIDPLLL